MTAKTYRARVGVLAAALGIARQVHRRYPTPARRHTPRVIQVQRTDEKGKIMARYPKTTRTLTVGAALLGALALSGPAHAADRVSIVTVNGDLVSQARSYGANGAVQICDMYPDGNAVSVHYYRKTGNLQTLKNSKGSPNCIQTTDIQSNPITLFKACVVINSVDICNPDYENTGR